MASLYEIMREQEDEKLARQLYTQNNYYQVEEDLFNSDLSDEELARRLQEQFGGYVEQREQEKDVVEHSPEETDEDLARRLQEEFDRQGRGEDAPEQNLAEEFDDDETAALRLAEDERLALAMQNEERSEVMHVHPKQFNAIEANYATLKQGHYDENGEEPDDEYYQELEDEDIAFMYRRMPEKQNMQSDDPKALHHQTYSTRNTGTKVAKTKRRIPKASRGLITQFRVKEEGFEYGVVLGPNLHQVYCYDGVTRQVHIFKKVLKTAWITRGSLVLVKLRPYQDEIADVVHLYSSEEVNRLYDMGEIERHDPTLHLPLEVMHIVIDFLTGTKDMHALRVLNREWNSLAQERDPILTKHSPMDGELAKRIAELSSETNKFHSSIYRLKLSKLTGCPSFTSAKSVPEHVAQCSLAKTVFKVAESVWSELKASRNDDSTDIEDENRQAGLEIRPLFTHQQCVNLTYSTPELNEFASCVLWTWWTVHKRHVGHRLDTVQDLIRLTLLRRLNYVVLNELHRAEREWERSEGKRHTQLKHEIDALKQHWQLVLHPTFGAKPDEPLGEEESDYISAHNRSDSSDDEE